LSEEQHARSNVGAVRITNGNEIIAGEAMMLSGRYDEIRQLVRAVF